MSSLIYAMAVPVYLTDPAGRILDYNQLASGLWGRSPTLSGAGEWFCGAKRLFHPDGSEMAHERCPMAEALRTGEPIRRARLMIERADGSRAVVLSNPFPIRDNTGHLLGASNCLIDVTQQEQTEHQLRESRERFRQLAESIEEVFWLTDWDQQIVIYVSPAYETIWGRPASGLYADICDWQKAIHPAERERVAKAFFSHAAHGTYEQEYRIYRPDGEQRWIHDRGFPIHDAHGQVRRVAGIAQDVTRRKRAEQQVRDHEKQLAHVSRLSLMGEMASGLGHELNQPLAAIGTYASGALRRLDKGSHVNSEVCDALRQVQVQARRAGDIVRSLREFVRRGEYERAPANVDDLVTEALELARPELQESGVELTRQLHGDLPHLMLGRIEIEQVLLNLVRNAIDAMSLADASPKRMTIATDRPDAAHVQVTVRDTGPGASDDELARMFSPFFTTKASGMGMGLNICETIVQWHNGQLWAERNTDRGLSLHLRLPMGRRGAAS